MLQHEEGTQHFLIFQHGLESWAVGLPTKLCLLVLSSQTPGLGPVPGSTWSSREEPALLLPAGTSMLEACPAG